MSIVSVYGFLTVLLGVFSVREFGSVQTVEWTTEMRYFSFLNIFGWFT